MDPEITLDIDFDNGSLDVQASRVQGEIVHLVGLENHNQGYWKWIHFRANGVQDRFLRFVLSDRFEPGTDRLANHRMVYSYDGTTWSYLTYSQLDEEGGRYVFGKDRPFERNSVFIAYGIPYPVSRVNSWVASLCTDPRVHPTESSDKDLIIGWSPGGYAEGGRTISPSPLYAFRMGESEQDDSRRKVVIFGGVHPNEPLGNFAIEGLVRYFLDENDAAAERLRSRADIYVYPMVNPDGRKAGYNRSTLQHVGRDSNRVWREDLYEDMDDIRQVAEAVLRDTGGEVDYFIDFHCWTNSGPHFGILARAEGFHEDPFWKAMRRIEPTLDEMDSGWENWSTETFAFKRLNARFAMTFETMFIPFETIERFQRLGANVGEALADAVAS
jgi:hypothetical protein